MTSHQRKNTTLVSKLLEWFADNARDLPWRRTRDPYAIWVSEIMLQQTQVKTVLGYWQRWMTALPTIEALAKAKSQAIHKLWEGLGYYTRVRNMQKAAQQIVARHAGQFPKNFDAILELPGIGRYTAGAIASIAFNEPRPILDGNVIRVLTRVFGIAGNPRDKIVNAQLWQLAQSLVDHAHECENGSRVGIPSRMRDGPQGPLPLNRVNRKSKIVNSEACSALNQSLMELGALICTPRQPKCPACPLRAQCVARRTGRTESLPNVGARQTATHRHFAAFVIERRGRFLVRQRPANTVNAHLWEFPNAEVTGLQFTDESAASTATNAPLQGPRVPLPLPSEGRGLGERGGFMGKGEGRGEVWVRETGRGASRMSGRSPTKLDQIATAELGFFPGSLQKLCTLKHSITRYRLTVTVFRSTLPSTPPPRALAGRWQTLPQLRRLPFTAAHRRILNLHLTG